MHIKRVHKFVTSRNISAVYYGFTVKKRKFTVKDRNDDVYLDYLIIIFDLHY